MLLNLPNEISSISKVMGQGCQLRSADLMLECRIQTHHQYGNTALEDIICRLWITINISFSPLSDIAPNVDGAAHHYDPAKFSFDIGRHL